MTEKSNQAKGKENVLADIWRDSIVDGLASGTVGSGYRILRKLFFYIFWLYFNVLASLSARYFFNRGLWQLKLLI